MGSINAQLAVNVAGRAIISGLTPIRCANAQMMGINVAVVAVLLVISVSNDIHVENSKVTRLTGIFSNKLSFAPSQTARPVCDTAVASDKPPPSSMSTPQGSCAVSCHARRRVLRSACMVLAGMMNRLIAPSMLIEASFNVFNAWMLLR